MADAATLDRRSQDVLQEQVQELALSARSLIDASRSDATRVAYERDRSDFSTFCERFGQTSMPATPEVVALYVADLSQNRGLSTSTVNRRLSAISVAHVEAGLESPTAHPAIRRMLSGLRRSRAGLMTNERRALSVTELEVLVAAMGDEASGVRDRALLLVGFVGGLRRSELIGIDVEHLSKSEDGYSLRIPKSKTDQEGAGRTVVLPYSTNAALCPVRSLDCWLSVARLGSGPVFRRIRRGDRVVDTRLSSQSVSLILKKRAEVAGIDSEKLAAHSLRSGFATAAAARGASERTIARQTGHRSPQVLRRYIQQATAFEDNAATELGL